MTLDASTLAITGGTVVNSDWSGPATVLVSDGKVQQLVQPDNSLPAGIDNVIDARGKLVLPGGVDPHCHVATTIGEFTTLDDYQSVSKAALYGGTTTIIDFAIPLPGESPLEAVRRRRKMADESRCSTALHGCVVEWDETVPLQLRQMAELGIRTVKLFTTYRDEIMADADTVLKVLETLAQLDGLAYVHAESDYLIRDAQAKRAESKHISAADHALTRPELAEVAAVSDVLAMTETAKASVYFVHQTNTAAVALVQEARRRGVRAYTESCPHYLLLDDGLYDESRPDRFVCCPPLRARGQVDGMRELAHRGMLHTLGSDHCCFSLAQKKEHAHDVRVMPNGMPGVETRLPVLFSKLVVDEALPLERFVALVAANPAKLNGIYPQKGIIAPGADADIVVFDPAKRKMLADASVLHMESDYTPYEGRLVQGWPEVVLSGGVVVIDGDDFYDPGPTGLRLNAKPFGHSLVC